MKNQNFDKFFKNNADERSFDFDESFWNEMETLIDEQDDSTPTAVPFNWKKIWITGIFCFGIGATLLFFALQSRNEMNTTSDKKDTSSSILSEEKTSSSTILNKENSTDTEKTAIENFNNEPVAVVSIIEKENKKLEKLENTSSKTAKTAKSIDKKINNNSFNSTSKNNKATLPKANHFPNQPNNKKVIKNEKTPKPVAILDERKDQNKEIYIFLENEINNDKPLVNNKIASAESTIIEEWVYLVSDINPLAVEVIQLKPFPLFEPTKENGNDEIKPKRVFQLGVIAGSHFYQGYKNMGEKSVPLSNDYFGGLYIKTALNQQWSGKIGLNYWQRDALNSVINADSTVYGFGATVYSKTVNIHHTQSIELPISVAYHLEKSSLTAGVQVSYLLNAKGVYQETVSDAFSTVSQAAITQNGYQTAFNRLDFGLSLGYEYQITKSFSIGGQAQIGFLDATNNNIFKNAVTDRNAMLKVYATYDFWKLKQ